jgi:hypothetical protein
MFMSRVSNGSIQNKPNSNAPAFGKRKAVFFCSCLVNYNKPELGEGQKVLKRNKQRTKKNSSCEDNLLIVISNL